MIFHKTRALFVLSLAVTTKNLHVAKVSVSYFRQTFMAAFTNDTSAEEQRQACCVLILLKIHVLHPCFYSTLSIHAS